MIVVPYLCFYPISCILFYTLGNCNLLDSWKKEKFNMINSD